jgi:hypothetical protein
MRPSVPAGTFAAVSSRQSKHGGADELIDDDPRAILVQRRLRSSNRSGS